jgi:hypothetical protein
MRVLNQGSIPPASGLRQIRVAGFQDMLQVAEPAPQNAGLQGVRVWGVGLPDGGCRLFVIYLRI